VSSVLIRNFSQRAQRVSVASVRNLFLDRRGHREETSHGLEILVCDRAEGSCDAGQMPTEGNAVGRRLGSG